MSEQIRLRRLTFRDEARLAELFLDPDTIRWNPGPADGDVTRWRSDAAAPTADATTWAVAGRADAAPNQDDDLLGVISLYSIDRAAGTAEVGFRIHPAARGRGIARTALSRVCDYARDIGVLEVTLFHATGNLASCRVAGAAGFALMQELPLNHRYGDGVLHDEHRHLRQLTVLTEQQDELLDQP